MLTSPETVRDVTLPLTAYELSALRLLVSTDLDRTARENPWTGPGPDTRAWPVAMAAIAAALDHYSTREEAATALATHYLTEAHKGGDANHG